MSQKVDISQLQEYIDYLKVVRCFGDEQIGMLCRPIVKLMSEKGYEAKEFLELSYVDIYEDVYGKQYRTRQTTAKMMRRAINYYQCYLKQKGDDEV